MDQAARQMSLAISLQRPIFILLMLVTVFMLYISFPNVKFNINLISGSDSHWIRYPTPKVYSTMQLAGQKTDWMHKLVQFGYLNHSFSPEERSEGTMLMNMIGWPRPPISKVPLLKSSDPSGVHFVILDSGKTFYVGDQMQVMLRMFDFEGNPKQYGGDYLQARIHTPELKAGSAGTVIDNQNGFYYINFTLLWPGKVKVSVTLVHPSEGVQVLHRLREERPDRVNFKSAFKFGSISETTMCNLYLSPTKPLCNFTDLRTGEPWFCYKPEKLPCTSRINHAKGAYVKGLLNGDEISLFRRGSNLKQPMLPNSLGYITVEPSPHAVGVSKECVRGMPLLSPSGYYYKDLWNPITCNIRRFETSKKITDCLRGKKIYLFGDSTIRQWFEYLTMFVPGLRKLDLGNLEKIGPHLAVDTENNIIVKYCPHGPPIRFTTISSPDLRYIANELDGIKGGKDTVVGITLWSHFSTFPIEVYIRRLQNIRRSILQLLGRNSDTVVVLRTANPQALPGEVSLYNSDWFSYQHDTVMRKMFTGINVAFVDAWEMTVAHYLPHELHPKTVIIKNQMDVFLSHVCPARNK
ncbi:NXPE family member 3-like [Leucoraja erinacea]|uniref:NXPE family member 3-like n=1 Tax=Leucoraja erinaceus TaxID=7782 RepID=UPI002458748E|nr:NXPE family member 3-like [Leucoraja erinacea]XP_055500940.1 NXPE family member 3-like [Leucoraja erinacea]